MCKTVLVDAEVVADLVDDRDPHLACQLVGIATEVAHERLTEDRDRGWRKPGRIAAERDPLVQSVQAPLVRRRVLLDLHDDVLEEGRDPVGEPVECVTHQILEVRVGHARHPDTLARPGTALQPPVYSAANGA